MNVNSEKINPIAWLAFRDLNKRVTVLGYPPLLGAILLALALMLITFSMAYKAIGLIFLATLYIPLFIAYTVKNRKNIKENRLSISSLLFLQHRRDIYYDTNSIINQIIQKKI